MKALRKFHTKSWSAYARRVCDLEVKFYQAGYYKSTTEIVKFFSQYYRSDLITNRAAKRLGRLRRTGKIV